MDSISPDQPVESRAGDAGEARYLLQGRHHGVLAMASGGCARYVFSTDALFCLDRRGYPLINYTSSNPHHHIIMTNSTMELRLNHRTDNEGTELSLFILTGMLKLVDPGDHDSIDRHARYFNSPTENYSRGASRLYRFVPEKACYELISGQRVPLNLDVIIQKHAFTEREEHDLVHFGSQCLRMQKNLRLPVTVAGVDSSGADLKIGDRIIRHLFATEANSKRKAELALTGMGDPTRSIS